MPVILKATLGRSGQSYIDPEASLTYMRSGLKTKQADRGWCWRELRVENTDCSRGPGLSPSSHVAAHVSVNSSMGFDTLFWPLWANTYTHKFKNIYLKIQVVMGFHTDIY